MFTNCDCSKNRFSFACRPHKPLSRSILSPERPSVAVLCWNGGGGGCGGGGGARAEATTFALLNFSYMALALSRTASLSVGAGALLLSAWGVKVRDEAAGDG